ncbi:MAG: GNAT family N-acetyltransferase [Thermodesulfobacteriota bacterium]
MEEAAEDRPRKRLYLNIRQMEIDDIAEVFHLGEELFTASEWPTLYRTWDEYEVITLFQSDPELCLVAELGDELVGFALGTTIEKSHSAWKYGYLVWLGVRPGLQRQGVAARLFRALRELMIEQGARILMVDTEADNLPALHFFRKQGFGSPQEHIFLSQNLDQRRRKNGERKGAAKAAELAPAGNGHDDPTPEVD